jgi:hypothetical protein
MDVAGSRQPDGTVQRYAPEDLLAAKQAMLEDLVAISGGTLLRGCCSQDCCDTGGCPRGFFYESIVA